MDKTQARNLITAADKLPGDLGRGVTFDGGKPCCALGHLASMLGVRGDDDSGYFSQMPSVYGLEFSDRCVIINANDDTPADERRATVITEIERMVRAFGFDPAVLRAEAVTTHEPGPVRSTDYRLCSRCGRATTGDVPCDDCGDFHREATAGD